MGLVRSFAQEQFAGRDRYALAVHADEPRPHVHMVMKATADGRIVRIR